MDENENIIEENLEKEPEGQDQDEKQPGKLQESIHLSGMYENWFLDYASYVILERAVPEVSDGLKPVHRRILHAMKDLDDGRYNKVANIIGHTMKYHPHGDTSIGDALVQLGQKDLLIDAQGNWGNILTGDSAAAPRYIEARLSKFALEVLFNFKTTEWKQSYDGRNKEPVTLPVKFPLLLAQGVEGIAVGLASKILPHNFNELIDASINILKDKDFEIYPDFPTGGLIDVSKYHGGLRGGKVRVRARIRKLDKKNLVITEMPFGITTSNLIESIVSANDKRKIRIRKIDDNTAEQAEIVVQLAQGVSPDQTIDALYAFTNCEISISPNSCVIEEVRPRFLNVHEILKISTQNTIDLLQQELQIRKAELQEHWHFASLEKIFIEERIYRNIENCKTWESVLETIQKGLQPFREKLLRDITQEDIVRLTEIRIKRISKYNSMKADEIIAKIEAEMEEVTNHLAHLIDYVINYFRQIKKKYGKGRERKTEIRNFDTIEAVRVVAASQKLYINREEGFAGTGLKKNEFVCDCSDIDDVIIFRADGTMLVTKIGPKVFVGKDLIYITVFKKNDTRTIYNVIYRDGRKGNYYVKRFPVKGVTRDKEYALTKGTEGSKVLYFTANPNGEAETVRIVLRSRPRLKKTSFEFDFSTLTIKGRGSRGNIITKMSVKSISKREEGVSTLGARNIWYDDTVNRLNADERGSLLGDFKGNDRILTINSSGHYKLYNYDLSTHFDDDMIIIQKFDPKKIFTVVYWDGKNQFYYVKRFPVELMDKKVSFLNDEPGNELIELSMDMLPRLELEFKEKNGKKRENETLNLFDFIGVKSYKAKGKRLSSLEIKKINMLEPLPYEELEEEASEKEVLADEIREEVLQEEMKDKAVPEETPPQEEIAGVQKKPEKKARKKKMEEKEKEKEKSDKNSPGTEDDGQIALEF